jgi:hypothetical protein
MILALMMGVFESSVCFNVRRDVGGPLQKSIDCDVWCPFWSTCSVTFSSHAGRIQMLLSKLLWGSYINEIFHAYYE